MTQLTQYLSYSIMLSVRHVLIALFCIFCLLLHVYCINFGIIDSIVSDHFAVKRVQVKWALCGCYVVYSSVHLCFLGRLTVEAS
jgi:hypothetical protein